MAPKRCSLWLKGQASGVQARRYVDSSGRRAPLCPKPLFLLARFCTVPVPRLAGRAEEPRAAGSSVHPPPSAAAVARAWWRAGGLSEPRQAILPLAGSHEQAVSALCLRRGRRHVPNVKKFGACFSWEVPVCDLREQRSAARSWGGRSPVRVGGARCPRLSPVNAPTLLIGRPPRLVKCPISCYLL